tara:strand:+ start:4449 stop:4661 length:213 start_codon:yes stop_codon:yes gene_type:complete
MRGRAIIARENDRRRPPRPKRATDGREEARRETTRLIVPKALSASMKNEKSNARAPLALETLPGGKWSAM